MLNDSYSSYFARLVMKKFFLLSLISFATFCTGCHDQPTCIPAQTDLMKLVFINEAGSTSEITFKQFLIGELIVLIDTSFSAVNVPLNPADSIIHLTFYQEADTNNITISYQGTPIVLHPECLLETKFDFLKIDSTNFLDAIIVDPLLSLETTQNVKIEH